MRIINPDASFTQMRHGFVNPDIRLAHMLSCKFLVLSALPIEERGIKMRKESLSCKMIISIDYSSLSYAER